MSKSKWWRLPPSSEMTTGEYEANIRGMNILFGAVLGFVLAGTTGLPPLDFAVVLLLSATNVVLILYLSQSPYKLFYLAMAALMIAVLPFFIENVLEMPPIPQLQPTLAVWTLMVIGVEIMPRERAPTSEENTE
ncbi:hypothetical protein ACRAQ6_07540 [Erythrobacter sp. HA6-11]